MEINKVEIPENKQTIFIANVKQSKQPLLLENKRDEWVWYGDDNLYPEYLLELLRGSATHNAIVQNKINLIYGEGLKALGLNTADTARISEFIKNKFSDENLNEILHKCIFDFVVFGGFALEVIYSNDGTKISQVEHVDFSTIRSGKKNEEGVVESYYISPSWERRYIVKNKPIRIDAYNEGVKSEKQLLYVKPYFAGNSYYPLPSYVGAINYIYVDVQTSIFHLNNIKNGMSPSMIVNFPYMPTKEEQDEIKGRLEENMAGNRNAGIWVCMFSTDKDSAPTFTPVQLSDADKLYTTLNELAVQNIITGHGVTSPMLFGIKTAGQIGGNQELITAFNIYNNNVIKPAQAEIVKAFNKIAAYNNLNAEFELSTKAPLAYSFSESVLTQILSKDELREIIGYKPLNEVSDAN
jgi:hypothetical protein